MEHLPTPELSSTAKSGRLWTHLAAWSSGTLLLLQLLRWPLISLLTVFLEPMLEIVITLFFLGVLIGSLVHAINRHRKREQADWAPFVVCIATVILVILVPFTSLYLKANFLTLRNRRTTIAERVIAGRSGHVVQTGSGGDLVALDGPDGFLSADGGEVVVDHRGGKTFVLFFPFRGILERFSGYVYSPSDDPPAKDEFTGDGREIMRVAPNWYWYAS